MSAAPARARPRRCAPRSSPWPWSRSARSAGCGKDRGLVLWHAYRAQERAALEELAAELERAATPSDARSSSSPCPTSLRRQDHGGGAARPRPRPLHLRPRPPRRLGRGAASSSPSSSGRRGARSTTSSGRCSTPSSTATRSTGCRWPSSPRRSSTTASSCRARRRPPTSCSPSAASLTDRKEGRFGLVYDSQPQLYFHAPWLHGFGGWVFGPDGKLDLANDGALKALAFARTLSGPDGIVPAEVEGHLVAALFNDGRAAMAITGPWFLGEVKQGVDFGVVPLPDGQATGKPAAPFLGVEGS